MQNNRRIELIPLFILFFVGAALSLTGNIKATIILFSIAAPFFFLINRKVLLSLYIVFLPLNGLFPKEFNVLGIMNINIIINLFALATLFEFNQKANKPTLTFHQQAAISFVYTLLFYFIYVDLKQVYFGMMGPDLFQAFSRNIYFILKYIPLVYFIKHIHHPDLKNIFTFSSAFTLVLLILSTAFAPFLASVGFKVSVIEYDYTNLVRYSGFLGGGDTNTLGAFLAIAVGFYLSRIERKEAGRLAYIIVFACIIGISLTVSRTAISALLLILIIFFFKNFNKKHVLSLMAILAIVSIVIAPVLESAIVRFMDYESQLQIGPNAGRLSKWIIYANDIKDNPTVLIYGTEHGVLETATFRSTEMYIAAHNVFLQMVHNAGLVPFLLLLVAFNKYRVGHKTYQSKYSSVYYILPFLIIYMYISDLGAMHYVVIYASLNEIVATRFSKYRPQRIIQNRVASAESVY